MRKRFVALTMAVALCLLSLFPCFVPSVMADTNTYTYDISQGNITISAGANSGTIKVSYGNGQSTDGILSTQPITITGNNPSNATTNWVKVDVSPGTLNITLKDVNINTSSACPFSIGNGTTVDLTLSGTNTLNADSSSNAGLGVPDGATLNITSVSTGYLTAIGGIGGGASNSSSGTVTISGGTVNATGGTNLRNGNYTSGSGIGGGGDGGTVTITGGTVTATGGLRSSGIGGGIGHSGGGDGGTVTITGGTVTAIGGDGGSGIGGGAGNDSGGNGGTVTISGGTVTATGGVGGSGIGGGAGAYSGGGGGTVKITGGLVTATGSVGGSGIGGGYSDGVNLIDHSKGAVSGGGGGTVIISGGSVTATGGGDGSACGSGIGSAYGSGGYGYSGKATITGGSVNVSSMQPAVYDSTGSTQQYPVTISNLPKSTDVSYKVNVGSSVSCSTDASGKLYLWLPTTSSAAVGIQIIITSSGAKYLATGQVSSSDVNNFISYPVPSITSISPTSGPEAGGTTVTISGIGFTGATAVKFGSTTGGSITVINDSLIIATVPAGSGTVGVTVTTPSGTSTTGVSQFSYIPAYTVAFDPKGGTVSPTSQIKLNGSTYGKAADGTTVEALPTPTRAGYTFGGWYDGDNATGNQITDVTTVTTTSNQTLYAKWNAAVPSIGTQPVDKNVNIGGSADLSISASGGATLSYQWHSNGTNSNSGGSSISGATGTSYSAITSTVGITYYYCVVTNTDSGANGNQTAIATSNAAKVTIAAASNVPVTGVTLDRSTLSLTVGGSNGTVNGSIMPANATNQVVTWSSSNPSAATVNSGVVIPVAAGNATITVTTQDGNKTATCAVTVASPIANPSVTVDTNNKHLAVTTNTPDGATINIPSNVTGATINVATLPVVGGTLTTNSLPALNIAAYTSISASPVQVVIPKGTTVSAGTNWDGTINVPTIMSAGSVNVTPGSGFTATVNSVIEIGYGDIPLTFSKAVRILIPGQTGKKVGYIRSGAFYPITTVLSADNQTTADSTLTAVQDGYLNVGSDLVIWTKHFTQFVTYTETPVAHYDVAINTAAIAGVTAPATGATPVSTIANTTEYTAMIAWSPAGATFAPSTAYTATITITPKTGYTLTGVAASFFTVAGATTVTNSAGSGVVTAVFPATASPYVPPYTPSWYSVTGVSLDKTSLSLSVGEAPSSLTASVQPNYASYPAVTWSSSDPTVASVNGGAVTPLTSGKTTITVTTNDGAKTANCIAIVTPSPGKNTQWDERQAAQSVAQDKTWRVRFSKAVGPESINRQNIMVLDSNNEPVEIDVKADAENDKIILVTPKDSYKKGEHYRLYLGAGLESSTGKSLSKGIVYRFTVE